jgi:hypothetical protein
MHISQSKPLLAVQVILLAGFTSLGAIIPSKYIHKGGNPPYSLSGKAERRLRNEST